MLKKFYKLEGRLLVRTHTLGIFAIKIWLLCNPQVEKYICCTFIWQRLVSKNQWDKRKLLNRKMGKDLNVDFIKEDIQMANGYRTKYSISLVIREMYTKTSMRYHYHS